MLRVCCAPPSTWALQALLNHVTVSALDFTRTNREVLRQRTLVIELFGPLAQIAVALAHWRVAIGNPGRFKLGL